MVFRRYFWVFALAALAGVAYFLASGASQLLGSALLGSPSTDSAPALTQARPRIPPRIHRRKDTHAILSRNIFDSEVGSLVATASTISPGDTAASPADAHPPRCDGQFKLVSTVVSDDPSWSFAAIGAGGKTMLYRVGGRVETSEVTRITWRYAFLRPTGGSDCYIGMFEPPEQAGSSRVAAATTASPTTIASSATSLTGNSELDSAIESGVQKVSESEYNVDRSLVDRLLENQASLMRSARILPHEDNGAVTGFKIYGVRRNSLLGKIGLQNGDIVHSINGYDMTSPDKALEAYARLRNADRLTVSVTRRGQRTNMDYNIR
ncbi:MAG: PDZ domain-containing protein [Deltaproteobacteria bacterium]|nr:PDZ domain-containing protein [Deltaproteobacteria bacterium]